MAGVTESNLPGVGLRIEFVSDGGNRVGVVHHHTGGRELYIGSPSDPDAAIVSIRLSDDESHTLADALGGSSIVERLDDLAQDIDGLVLDWLTVDSDSPLGHKTIGEARVRTRTGVSIVAVIREGETYPAPGPEFDLQEADTLVVVGTADGLEAAREVLTKG